MQTFLITVGERFKMQAEGMDERVALAMIAATLVLGILAICAWAFVQTRGAK